MTAHVARAQPGRGHDPESVPIGTDLRVLLNRPGNRTVILDSSRDPNCGVTLLLIPAGTEQPELAVKLATTAMAATVIEREARLLDDLRRRLTGPVGQTLPRLAGVYHADGLLAVATTVVPGVPMRTRYHEFGHLRRPAAVRADFAAAADWLAEVQAVSTGTARPGRVCRSR